MRHLLRRGCSPKGKHQLFSVASSSSRFFLPLIRPLPSPHPHAPPPANPSCFQFPEHARHPQLSLASLFPPCGMPTFLAHWIFLKELGQMSLPPDRDQIKPRSSKVRGGLIRYKSVRLHGPYPSPLSWDSPSPRGV